MPYVVLRDQVTNYESYRAAIERDAARRQLYGCKGVRLMRSHGDPADVVAVVEFASMDDARSFVTADLNAELDAWMPTTGYSEAVILDEMEDLPG